MKKNRKDNNRKQTPQDASRPIVIMFKSYALYEIL